MWLGQVTRLRSKPPGFIASGARGRKLSICFGSSRLLFIKERAPRPLRPRRKTMHMQAHEFKWMGDAMIDTPVTSPNQTRNTNCRLPHGASDVRVTGRDRD